MKRPNGFPVPLEFLRTLSGGTDGLYVIGAMFTAGYSDKAVRLAASCEKFGLRYVIHEVPTVHRSISARGSDDLAYTKANFIRHLLATYKKPVLYLDADCEVMAQPDLIDDLVRSRCDFAIYNGCAEEYTDMFVPVPLSLEPGAPPIRDRFFRVGAILGYHSKTQLQCCGLVQFWQNSLAARALLARWHRAIAAFPGCADDACLSFVFNNLSRRSWLSWRLKVAWLPKSYARICWWLYVKPVINHPDWPRAVDHFTDINDPAGRKQLYMSQVETRRDGLFPRGCIIDIEQRMLCKLVDGTLVPIAPTEQSFWL